MDGKKTVAMGVNGVGPPSQLHGQSSGTVKWDGQVGWSSGTVKWDGQMGRSNGTVIGKCNSQMGSLTGIIK